MDADDVRVAVYRAFAEDGRAPSVDQIAAETGRNGVQVIAALEALADAHHLVLNGEHEVVMAHPFSSVPLGFAVMGSRALWWGGCAWDSFALPHLVGARDSAALLDGDAVLVSTRCPACSRPHAWNVSRVAPPIGNQVAHFLVPAAHMWDDVVHTCGHQRIFCSTDCVAQWLAGTGNSRGYVMTLATLWRLARHWYDGRLEYGYQRRDHVDGAVAAPVGRLKLESAKGSLMQTTSRYSNLFSDILHG